jgi:hypothetical protein
VSRSKDLTRVLVRKEVGSLLMIRSSVAPLFDKISSLNARRVVVDFSGVEFMSRSFADEYLVAKSCSPKRLEETRIPTGVKRMFALVSRRNPTNTRTHRESRSSIARVISL